MPADSSEANYSEDPSKEERRPGNMTLEEAISNVVIDIELIKRQAEREHFAIHPSNCTCIHSNSSSGSTAATDFPRFGDFSPELQIMVWREATCNVSTARTIFIEAARNPPGQQFCIPFIFEKHEPLQATMVRALLETCRLSRFIVSKDFKICYTRVAIPGLATGGPVHRPDGIPTSQRAGAVIRPGLDRVDLTRLFEAMPGAVPNCTRKNAGFALNQHPSVKFDISNISTLVLPHVLNTRDFYFGAAAAFALLSDATDPSAAKKVVFKPLFAFPKNTQRLQRYIRLLGIATVEGRLLVRTVRIGIIAAKWKTDLEGGIKNCSGLDNLPDIQVDLKELIEGVCKKTQDDFGSHSGGATTT